MATTELSVPSFALYALAASLISSIKVYVGLLSTRISYTKPDWISRTTSAYMHAQ